MWQMLIEKGMERDSTSQCSCFYTQAFCGHHPHGQNCEVQHLTSLASPWSLFLSLPANERNTPLFWGYTTTLPFSFLFFPRQPQVICRGFQASNCLIMGWKMWSDFRRQGGWRDLRVQWGAERCWRQIKADGDADKTVRERQRLLSSTPHPRYHIYTHT